MNMGLCGELRERSLHWAVIQNCPEAVQERLGLGVNTDIETQKTGFFPFHLACQFGSYNGFVHLTTPPTLINASSPSGLTPLHLVAERCVKYVQHLLSMT
jgi:ankyrin repeat protein